MGDNAVIDTKNTYFYKQKNGFERSRQTADKPHHTKGDYQFAQNKEAPLCKGSCREATEGLFFIEFMYFTIPPPRSSAPPFTQGRLGKLAICSF